MKTTGENYPCGPCELPLICSSCGKVITEDNAVDSPCEEECEVCDYCSTKKCVCGNHVCCGGCI